MQRDLTPTQIEVYQVVVHQPGIKESEIELTYPTARHTLRVLEQKGLLYKVSTHMSGKGNYQYKPYGENFFWYPNDPTGIVKAKNRKRER